MYASRVSSLLQYLSDTVAHEGKVNLKETRFDGDVALTTGRKNETRRGTGTS